MADDLAGHHVIVAIKVNLDRIATTIRVGTNKQEGILVVAEVAIPRRSHSDEQIISARYLLHLDEGIDVIAGIEVSIQEG